jgi:AraC-like DNA-binding protein
MVAERGDTCTVVRAVGRPGDRRTCWRPVEGDELLVGEEIVGGEVRGDGPIVHGEVVRATVGLVRVDEPKGGGGPRFPVAGRAGRERYRLIVELHTSEEQVERRLPAVVLDVVTVTLSDVTLNDVTLTDRTNAPVALQDVRRDNMVERVRAFIESHLSDPALTPAAVAAAHHISLRYLHKLFEPEPHGVAGLIRQRRLERCRHDLLDAAQADRPVSGIAAHWGFSSAAHFSRVFREVYGLPPAEFRRVHHLWEAS